MEMSSTVILALFAGRNLEESGGIYERVNSIFRQAQ